MNELPIKNEYASGLLELSRLCSTWRVTGNQLISSQPLWLVSVHVEADNAGNKTQVKLINGETTSDSVLYNLKQQYGHLINIIITPVYFNRGLFIDFIDNVEAVTVQYLIDSP